MAELQVTQIIVEMLTVGEGEPPAVQGSTPSAASALFAAGTPHVRLPRASATPLALSALWGTVTPAITLSRTVAPTAVSLFLAAGTPTLSGPAVVTVTRVLWSISGTTGILNPVVAQGTTLSGEWLGVSGTAPFTYQWSFGQVTHQAGFVSTATTASITRTYTVGGGPFGHRQVSTTVSDAAATSFTSSLLVYVGAVQEPNLFDGVIQQESQSRRRVWPL